MREYGCARVTQKITDYVDDDDAGSSKLNVESFAETDQQRHGHGQNRQQEFVLHSGKSAGQCHGGVQ